MNNKKRAVTVDDLYNIAYVEDPRISPDEQWIAYVHMTIGKVENTYQRNIWVVNTDGGQPIQLTRGDKDIQPRWSPDSNILAFVSVRDNTPQIYLLPVTSPGGEPRKLTQMKNGASHPEWSPDGLQIAYLSSMNAEERSQEDSGEAPPSPTSPFELKQKKEREDHEEKEKWDPRPMWRIPYRGNRTLWSVPPRSITSYLDERYDQVYVINVDDGEPCRLTNYDTDSGPPKWMPDGKSVVCSRPRDPEADEPYLLHSLVRISVTDGSEVQLTGEGYSNSMPVPSPNGEWIAYLRTPLENFFASQQRLSVILAEGGEPRDLTVQFDRSVDSFKWSSDSRHLLFNSPDQGTVEIYQVPVGGGEIEKIVRRRMDTELFDVSSSGSIAFSACTPVSPPELYYLAPGMDDPLQMTEANSDWLEEVIIQPTHEMWFESKDGTNIQGWYILPVGYQEGEQYPLVFNIHGGPHVMWSPSTKTKFHEWQFYAASGYVVFYCNPRGSDGYGEKYRDAIHGAWGEADFPDLMTGIDTLLQKGFVDEKRMAVTGGSYGGFMTAWVLGHTNRFVSAASQRGVYSMISFYGTTDIPALGTHELGVEPWEDSEFLWKNSPLAYAHNIKTPLLIIHSENDFRVPIAEAEQLFALVRRSGGKVKMLRYPREGHELSRSGEPLHRVSRLTEMIEWFDEYCQSTRA